MGLQLKSLQPFKFLHAEIIPHDRGNRLALILQVAKPFPILELPPAVLGVVLEHVFAPQGVMGGKIKVSTAKSVLCAPEYAESMANRVGMLRVSKAVS